MKTLFLILPMLLYGYASYCQDWVSVGADTDGDKWFVQSTYVKKESSKNSGTKIKVWIKGELAQKKISKDGQSQTYENVKELHLMIADCTEGQVKFVATKTYNAQGKLVDSTTTKESEQEWLTAEENSLAETILLKVCELFD